MKWASMYTIVATLAVIATSFVLTQQIQAQDGKMIITFLSGKDEVPPTESNASAWAKFQSVDNDSQLSYWVSIIGLKEITGAHVHKGSDGQNGDIVAVLSEAKSAEEEGMRLSR